MTPAIAHTVYLAGPMRGIPDFNFPAFLQGADLLRDVGYEVISPAERDIEQGFAYAGTTGHEDLTTLDFDLSDALAWDLDQIARSADLVVVLPGWEHSSGAQAEVATAKALRKPVLTLDNALDLPDEGDRVRLILRPFVRWGVTSRTWAIDLNEDNIGVEYVVGEVYSDGDVELLIPGTLDYAGVTSPTALIKVDHVPSPLAQAEAVVEAAAGGEVRTFSETGGAKGVKPARFDQIPADFEWELAEHYGKGNGKYPPTENGLDNWRNGYEWSKNIGAIGRHFNAFKRGEDIDPETGSKHLVAVAWHCATLIHWMNQPELRERFDDRQDVIEGRVRALSS